MKGKPFAPDERRKRILTEAAAAANATAGKPNEKAINFKPVNPLPGKDTTGAGGALRY